MAIIVEVSNNGFGQWRDNSLISIWGDTSVQTKLEGFCCNCSVFKGLQSCCHTLFLKLGTID